MRAISAFTKSAQGGSYEEQVRVGKHLTTTALDRQEDGFELYRSPPRDRDHARVALGLAYFAMAASNETVDEAKRPEAEREMKNAIAAIKIEINGAVARLEVNQTIIVYGARAKVWRMEEHGLITNEASTRAQVLLRVALNAINIVGGK